jgi:hypothetical protein
VARAELERRGVKAKPEGVEEIAALEPAPPTTQGGSIPDFRLSVGSVITRTFDVWMGNIASFSIFGFLVNSPVLVALVYVTLSREPHPVLGALATLAQRLLSLVITGGITYGVFEHLRDEHPTVGDVLRNGFSSLGRVWAAGLYVSVLSVMGFCALIVPGLILTTMYWVAVPVAVIESPGASASLKRSQELTEGSRWAILAIILALAFVVFATAITFGVILRFVEGALGKREQLKAWQAVLVQLWAIPLGCFYAVGPAVVYHDLRVGKEGADVGELLKVFE